MILLRRRSIHIYETWSSTAILQLCISMYHLQSKLAQNSFDVHVVWQFQKKCSVCVQKACIERRGLLQRQSTFSPPHFAVAIFFFTFITIQARILSMVYWVNNQHISWTYVISNEKHPLLLRGSKRERRKPLHFANINYQCCIITTPVRDTSLSILENMQQC